MTLATAPGMNTSDFPPGFTNPVHDAQRTFRAILDAMARPTNPQPIAVVADDEPLETPAPLGEVVGAVLLTLCDEQTPVWLDPALRASADVCTWLTFHTGARIVDEPSAAQFVVASSPSAAPPLADLAQGTDEEPHLSATLVIDATGTQPIESFTATGPGINGEIRWDGAGLPRDFVSQWQMNRAQFPCGVDVMLADAKTVRGLPRTTNLTPHSAGTEPHSTSTGPRSTSTEERVR